MKKAAAFAAYEVVTATVLIWETAKNLIKLPVYSLFKLFQWL